MLSLWDRIAAWAKFAGWANARGPCPICKNGRRYLDNTSMIDCCTNHNCTFVLTLEDEIKDKQVTSLKTLPSHIVDDLTARRIIPRNWFDIITHKTITKNWYETIVDKLLLKIRRDSVTQQLITSYF